MVELEYTCKEAQNNTYKEDINLKYAIELVIKDKSKILDMFNTKDAAMDAVKNYLDRCQPPDTVISVISADFESDDWKICHKCKVHKTFW